MALVTGAKLGPYEVLSPAGAGGMGEVYRARDTRLDRTVAIKVLPEQYSNNLDLKQRLERETRAISGLNHPIPQNVWKCEACGASWREETDEVLDVRPAGDKPL